MLYIPLLPLKKKGIICLYATSSLSCRGQMLTDQRDAKGPAWPALRTGAETKVL